MTLYLIVHAYDVDGGFGDPVDSEDVLYATEDKEKAKAYCEKYNNPVPYSKPYATLYKHRLFVRAINAKELDIDKSPWEDEAVYDPYDSWYEEKKKKGEV